MEVDDGETVDVVIHKFEVHNITRERMPMPDNIVRKFSKRARLYNAGNALKPGLTEPHFPDGYFNRATIFGYTTSDNEIVQVEGFAPFIDLLLPESMHDISHYTDTQEDTEKDDWKKGLTDTLLEMLVQKVRKAIAVLDPKTQKGNQQWNTGKFSCSSRLPQIVDYEVHVRHYFLDGYPSRPRYAVRFFLTFLDKAWENRLRDDKGCVREYLLLSQTQAGFNFKDLWEESIFCKNGGSIADSEGPVALCRFLRTSVDDIHKFFLDVKQCKGTFRLKNATRRFVCADIINTNDQETNLSFKNMIGKHQAHLDKAIAFYTAPKHQSMEENATCSVSKCVPSTITVLQVHVDDLTGLEVDNSKAQLEALQNVPYLAFDIETNFVAGDGDDLDKNNDEIIMVCAHVFFPFRGSGVTDHPDDSSEVYAFTWKNTSTETLQVCLQVKQSDAPQTWTVIVKVAKDEGQMLEDFREFLLKSNARVMCGYNSIDFDLRHVIRRAPLAFELSRNPLAMSYSRRVKSANTFGEAPVVKSPGIAHFDLSSNFEKLGDRAEALIGTGKDNVSYADIHPMWMSEKDTDRDILVKYCARDVIITKLIGYQQDSFNFKAMMCSVLRTDPQILFNNDTIPYMDALFLRECEEGKEYFFAASDRVYKGQERECKTQEEVHSTNGREVTEEWLGADIKLKYRGGLVREPVAGLYANPVVCLDFSAQYPNIIIAMNICPTTNIQRYNSERERERNQDLLMHASNAKDMQRDLLHTVCRKERGASTITSHNFRKNVDYHECPVVNDDEMDVATDKEQKAAVSYAYVTAAHRKGVTPSVVKKLMALRTAEKKSMKQVDKDSAAYKLHNSKQLVCKQINNSIYGYFGCSSEHLPCAASITGRARYDITRCARQVMFQFPTSKIIYGDTDSIFVSLHPKIVTERLQWTYFETLQEQVRFSQPDFYLPFRRTACIDFIDACEMCKGGRWKNGVNKNEDAEIIAILNEPLVRNCVIVETRDVDYFGEVPRGTCDGCRKKIKKGLLDNAYATGRFMEKYLNETTCPSGDKSQLIVKPSSIEMEKVMAPLMLVKAKNYFGLKYEGCGDKVRVIVVGLVMKKRDSSWLTKVFCETAMRLILVNALDDLQRLIAVTYKLLRQNAFNIRCLARSVAIKKSKAAYKASTLPAAPAAALLDAESSGQTYEEYALKNMKKVQIVPVFRRSDTRKKRKTIYVTKDMLEREQALLTTRRSSLAQTRHLRGQQRTIFSAFARIAEEEVDKDSFVDWTLDIRSIADTSVVNPVSTWFKLLYESGYVSENTLFRALVDQRPTLTHARNLKQWCCEMSDDDLYAFDRKEWRDPVWIRLVNLPEDDLVLPQKDFAKCQRKQRRKGPECTPHACSTTLSPWLPVVDNKNPHTLISSMSQSTRSKKILSAKARRQLAKGGQRTVLGYLQQKLPMEPYPSSSSQQKAHQNPLVASPIKKRQVDMRAFVTVVKRPQKVRAERSGE